MVKIETSYLLLWNGVGRLIAACVLTALLSFGAFPSVAAGGLSNASSSVKATHVYTDVPIRGVTRDTDLGDANAVRNSPASSVASDEKVSDRNPAQADAEDEEPRPHLFALQAVLLEETLSEETTRTFDVGALEAVASGRTIQLPSEGDAGFIFEPGEVEVNLNGMSITGTGVGMIKYPQPRPGEATIRPGALTVEFSTDFVLDGDPLEVRTGKAEFVRGLTTIATLDRDGFHLTVPKAETPIGDEERILAQIPADIPLPTSDLAFLRVRENGAPDGEWLVDPQVNSDGSVTFANSGANGDAAPVIHVPALRSTSQSNYVTVDAQFDPYLTIDPVTTTLLDGNVAAIQSPSNPIFDFGQSTWGNLPFLLTGIVYDPINGGLRMNGHFRVLEGVLPQREPLSYRVGPDGRIGGTDSKLGGDDIRIVEGSDNVVLQPAQVTATLNLPLLGGDPTYNVDLNGTYLIQQNASPAAGAQLQMEVTPSGIQLFGVTSLPNTDMTPLDLGDALLDLNRVETLEAVYRADGSQMLRATLAAEIGHPDVPFTVPLADVQLDRDGFFIPSQSFQQEGSTNSEIRPFQYGALRLGLIGLRLPTTTFDWFAWSPGQPSGISLDLDFEARLPGFVDRSPALSQEAFTVQNARFVENGIDGEWLERVLDGGADVKLGSAVFRVSSVSGRVIPLDGPQANGVDLRLRGQIATSNIVTLSGADAAGSQCSNETEVMLKSNAGLASVNGPASHAVCGTVAQDPLVLDYTPTGTSSGSTVEFTYDGGVQQVIIDGTVAATFADGRAFTNGQGSGRYAMDLVSGEVRESDLTMQNIHWSYPKQAPVFDFRVETADITTTGLSFRGDGRVGPADVPVTFDALQVPFEGHEILSGQVQFNESFVLAGTLPSLVWSIADSETLPDAATDALRLTVPSGQTLTRAGLQVDGSGTGSYTTTIGTGADATLYEETRLDAAYDALTFAFETTMRVTSGRVDLKEGAALRAWVDASGLQIEGVPESQTPDLPDRIALGTEEIGYLPLRSADGTLLVTTEQVASGWRIQTKDSTPAPVVFVGLGDSEGAISYDIRVNNAFQLQSLSRTALADTATVTGTPLRIHDIEYSENEGLTVVGTMDMDMDAGGAGLAIPFEGIAATNGFADGEIIVGVQPSDRHAASMNTTAPIDTVHYDATFAETAPTAQRESYTIEEAVTVLSRGATIDYANGQFRIHGDITSPVLGRVELDPNAGCAYGAPVEQEPGPFHLGGGDGTSAYAASATIETCPAVVHYDASWSGTAWNVTPENNASGGVLPVGTKGTFTYEAGGMTIPDGPGFGLELAGTLGLPGLSVGFDIAIDKMRLGSDGITVEANTVDQQQMEVRRNLLILQPEPNTLAIRVEESAALAVSFSGGLVFNAAKVEQNADGSWRYQDEPTESDAINPAYGLGRVRDRITGRAELERENAQVQHSCSNAQVTSDPDEATAIAFEGMRLTTNGDLGFGEGEINLLAGYKPISIVGDRVCVDYLALGMKDSGPGGDNDAFMRIGVVADIPTMKKKESLRSGRQWQSATPTATQNTESDSDDSNIQLTGILQTGFTDNSFEVNLYGIFDDGESASSGEQIQSFVRKADEETQDAFYSATYDPQINGSPLEIPFGDKAVFEVTGLGLDLDFENTDFRLSTALALHVYMGQDRQRTGQNLGGSNIRSGNDRVVNVAERTDSEGRAYKTMMFGDPRMIAAGGGIWFRFRNASAGDQGDGETSAPDEPTDSNSSEGEERDPGDGSFFTASNQHGFEFSMGWNLNAESESGLLSVDGGLFSATITQFAVNPDRAYVTMGGNATLDLPKVQGQFGIKGFTVGQDTLSLGEPQGPFMLAVDSYMAMEVGCIDWGARQNESADALSFDRPVPVADTTDSEVSWTTETVSDVDKYFLFSACGTDSQTGSPKALRLAVFSDRSPDSFLPPGNRPDSPATTPATQTAGDADAFEGSLFRGSVEQIVYYEKTEGDTYFKLSKARIELGGSGQVEAFIQGSVEVQTQVTESSGTNVGVEVDGLAVLGIGKNPATGEFKERYGLLAQGKFSTINNELSIGFFLAGSGFTIPIVPGVVDLNGAGGGFFWNPEADDITDVYEGLRGLTGGDFASQNPNGLPRSNDLKLAIMLYAEVGIGGSAGNYAANTYSLITVTDQFFTLDLSGKLNTPNAMGGLSSSVTNLDCPPESGVKFGGYLAVLWQPEIQGLQGGVRLHYAERVPATDKVIASGRGQLDVFFTNVVVDASTGERWDGVDTRPASSEEDFQWGIAGYLGLKIFPDDPSPTSAAFITSEAGLIINDAGFLFGLDYTLDKDFAIVNLYAHAGIEFWYNAVQQEVGAFAEAEAKVSIVVLGHAQLSAQLGVVPNENDHYMLFGSGSGEFYLFSVFEVKGSFWFSATAKPSGLDLDGGTGTNDRFRTLVAESQSDLRGAAEETQAAMDEVQQAARDWGSFAVTDEEAQDAGRQLIAQAIGVRRQAVDDMLAIENAWFDYMGEVGISSIQRDYFNQVARILKVEDFALDGFEEEAQALNDAIDRLNERALRLDALYETIDATLDDAEFVAASAYRGTSPVTRTDGGGFAIDASEVNRQREAFNGLRAAASTNSTEFIQSIQQIDGSLARLDSLMYGGEDNLSTFGADFAVATEQSGALVEARRRTYAMAWVWAKVIRNKFQVVKEGAAGPEDGEPLLKPLVDPEMQWDATKILDVKRHIALLAANRRAVIDDLNDGTYDGNQTTLSNTCVLSGQTRYTAYPDAEWRNLLEAQTAQCPSQSQYYQELGYSDYASYLRDMQIANDSYFRRYDPDTGDNLQPADDRIGTYFWRLDHERAKNPTRRFDYYWNQFADFESPWPSAEYDGISFHTAAYGGIRTEDMGREVQDYYNLLNLAEENGRNLWITMPDEALTTLTEGEMSYIVSDDEYHDRVIAPYETTLDDVGEQWSSYTNRLDRAYARKSALTEKLATMYKAYSEWAETQETATAQDDAGAEETADGQQTTEQQASDRETTAVDLDVSSEAALDAQQAYLRSLRPPRLESFNRAVDISYEQLTVEDVTTISRKFPTRLPSFQDIPGLDEELPNRPVATLNVAWETSGSTLVDSYVRVDRDSQPIGGSIGNRTRFQIALPQTRTTQTATEVGLELRVRSASGVQYRITPEPFTIRFDQEPTPLYRVYTYDNGSTSIGTVTPTEEDPEEVDMADPDPDIEVSFDVEIMAREIQNRYGSRYFLDPAADKIPVRIIARGAQPGETRPFVFKLTDNLDQPRELTPHERGYLNGRRTTPGEENIRIERGELDEADSVFDWEILTGTYHHPGDEHGHDAWILETRIDRDIILSANEADDSPGERQGRYLQEAFGIQVQDNFGNMAFTPFRNINFYEADFSFPGSFAEIPRALRSSYVHSVVPLTVDIQEETEIHAGEYIAPYHVVRRDTVDASRMSASATLSAKTATGTTADSLVFEYRLHRVGDEGDVYGDWTPIKRAPDTYVREETETGEILHRVRYTEDHPLYIRLWDDHTFFSVEIRARGAFQNRTRNPWRSRYSKTFAAPLGGPTLRGGFNWFPRPAPDATRGALRVTNEPVSDAPRHEAPIAAQEARPLMAFRRPVPRTFSEDIDFQSGSSPYRVLVTTYEDINPNAIYARNVVKTLPLPEKIVDEGINWDYSESFSPWRYDGSQRDVAVNGPNGIEYYRTYTDAGTWEPFYLHFHVEDQFGQTQVRTEGPFQAADPTRPQLPDAVTSPGNQYLYLTKPSVDPESGVAGYQIALGTEPGGTDLQAWPDDGAPTLLDTDLFPSGPGKARHFKLAPLLANIQHTGRIYVTLRAVNNQGQVSHYVGASWVQPNRDDTPPQQPVVQLEKQRSARAPSAVDGEISNVYDGQSGIRRVRYRLLNANGDASWVVLHDHQNGDATDERGTGGIGGLLSPLSPLTFTISREELGAPTPWSLEVEVTNGQGLTRTRVINATYEEACLAREERRTRANPTLDRRPSCLIFDVPGNRTQQNAP